MEDSAIVPPPNSTTMWNPTNDSNATGYSDLSPTQEEFIMPAGVLQLVSWALSGIKANQEGFQKELHDYMEEQDQVNI